jgi:Zn-dependent M16 (insulinase) family peptidase
VIQFTLSGVDATKLPEVEARFFEVLKEAAATKLDMGYMQDCIIRHKRKLKSSAENGATFFTDTIIGSFLFGDSSTLRKVADLEEFDTLEKWTEFQWIDFLEKWISGAPHITILGKPSAALSKRLKDEEEARVAKQNAELGETGLQKLAERLAAAKAENDKEVPRQMLERFQVPDTSSIHFINTTTARSGAARKPITGHPNPIQDIIDQDASKLPLFIHFEHIQSNFVQISVLIGTESIPVSLRPLLAVYLDNFFNSPIERDGKRIEFEQVVMELEKDTVDYEMDSASSLGNPEGLRVMIQVEAEKYETAIRWIRCLMWDSIFDITVMCPTSRPSYKS